MGQATEPDSRGWTDLTRKMLPSILARLLRALYNYNVALSPSVSIRQIRIAFAYFIRAYRLGETFRNYT